MHLINTLPSSQYPPLNPLPSSQPTTLLSTHYPPLHPLPSSQPTTLLSTHYPPRNPLPSPHPLGTVIGLGVLPSLLKQPGACEWTDDIEGGQPNVGAVSTFTATAVDRVHVSYFSSFDFEKLFGPASSSLALYASREMTDHYAEASREVEELQLTAPMRANEEAQKLKRLYQGMPKKVNEKSFLDVKPLVVTSTGMVRTASLHRLPP